jgi:tRNA acetyltransferase TAN1
MITGTRCGGETYLALIKEGNFNLLISCIRNRERSAILETEDLIGNVVGDRSIEVELVGIRSLLVAKTSFEPREVIRQLRATAIEDPWRFQYTLRYIPIDIVTPTQLDSIVEASKNLAARILEHETFRVTCNRRHSRVHCTEIIKSIAALIDRKVDLEKPTKVFEAEVIGEWTGLAVLDRDDVLSLAKL